MIRFFDILFSLFGLLVFSPIIVFLYIVGLFETGSPIFFQERIGRNKKPFILIKFRTMEKSSKSVATHLMDKSSITKMGAFLRKSKLDELPQLFNVLLGSMSLVGPRPNLFNQLELISQRDKLNVYSVRPGITGLAQIKEIDMSTPELLAKTDAIMIEKMSITLYFAMILSTITGSGFGDRIKVN
ncbi:MAG: lipid carrier--UDP-N-acetylgalactosaminyltransferase [Bacteroidetes bacterium B1(2017)]|nr:MAG: lipid carrier--UDP-N-acetylgalactosaminyltransferase [Bacteroidetes bacterium B1(2017)]